MNEAQPNGCKIRRRVCMACFVCPQRQGRRQRRRQNAYSSDVVVMEFVTINLIPSVYMKCTATAFQGIPNNAVSDDDAVDFISIRGLV